MLGIKEIGIEKTSLEYNVEFGPPPTLHGTNCLPIEDFTITLLITKQVLQRTYTTHKSIEISIPISPQI